MGDADAAQVFQVLPIARAVPGVKSALLQMAERWIAARPEHAALVQAAKMNPKQRRGGMASTQRRG